MGILENVQDLRRQIDEAARQSGRTGADITLVAATKTQTVEAVRGAVLAGVDACGENRVQELTEKNSAGAYEGAPIHFIGHLQKNKVRKVVGLASLIQSVDSIELLQAIDRIAAEQEIVQEVLLQVNIGDDANKFGIHANDVDTLLDQIEALSSIQVRGLMTILPILSKSSEIRALYAQMHQVYVDIRRKSYHNIRMDFLSMGMSGDFREAILEGANMIRVGSTIFGNRT